MSYGYWNCLESYDYFQAMTRATMLHITHSLLQQTLNELAQDGTVHLCIKGIDYVREQTIRPGSQYGKHEYN